VEVLGFRLWQGVEWYQLFEGTGPSIVCRSMSKHVTGLHLKQKLFCFAVYRETKKTAVKRGNDLISEDIVSSQGTVSDAILQKREKSRGGGSGCFASPNLSLSRNADEGTSGGRQMDVLSSFDKSTVSVQQC